MKIIYGKSLSFEETLKIQEIANACGITFNTARLLYYRNFTTVESALKFFSAGKNNFLNPYGLSGMEKAVSRIKSALINGEKVLIYGDYDADGITATTILYFAFKDYGINAEFTVPERAEGYGLNVEKVRAMENGRKFDLIVTVDCGISDVEKIDQFIKTGTDVIVTDHHEIPEILPSCTIINPKLSGQEYGFQGLCGAGVAFKLATALIGEIANRYLDLVTLATLADSMDLIDENRDIVVEGLKIFNNDIRPCFKYLLGDSNKNITAQTLVYALAPRINAGGRMGDAQSALKLLTTDNEQEIVILAERLNAYNVQRQALCDSVHDKAREIIIRNKLYSKEVILVKNDDWQVGVIGIVAARLVEEFNRPVIVFAGENGFYKGSARSVQGINVFSAIESAKDCLIAFGGHSQAAGLSVKKEDFFLLEKKLCEYVRENALVSSVEKEINVDWELSRDFDTTFMREIDKLEPFGIGNRKPLFTMKANAVYPVPLKVDSPHYTFRVGNFTVLDFGGEKDVINLQLPVEKTLFIEMNYSIYKGKEYFKGTLKNYLIDFSDLSPLKNSVFNNEIQKIKSAEKYSGEVSVIEYDRSLIKSGFGTLYVLADPENLKKYDTENLRLYFGEIQSPNYSNSILVSPNAIPVGYEKVVYLDRPLTMLQTSAKVYVVNEVLASALFSDLKTERNDLGSVFNALKRFGGRRYTNSFELATAISSDLDFCTALLGIEVFAELKLTYIRNGCFYIDNSKVSALTNSNIYNKICLYGK